MGSGAVLASLFGALIGALFALVGGWLSNKWQSEREAHGVASALLAELSLAEALLETGAGSFYQQMLAEWKNTGEVRHRQAVIDLFDNDPQEALPVYYAMAGKLGLLPKSLASDVVTYHSKIIALPRTIVRFLGKQELERRVVQDIAGWIEQQFHELSTVRRRLIVNLGSFCR